MADLSPGEARGTAPDRLTVSFFALLAPPLERWRAVTMPTLLLAGAGLVYASLASPRFTAEATFTPHSQTSTQLASLAGLAGLAGQLGLASSQFANLSPEFFASVLQSRDLMEQTLRSTFVDPRDGVSRSLLSIMRVEPAVGNDTVSEGVRQLRRRLTVTVDRRTAVITLRVQQGGGQLASDVANRMIELLNEFNLDRRQSQSREQTRFTRRRMETAGEELQAAEGALLQFLTANRSYRGSPLLEFESERLQRQVALKQEIYVTLAKAYEESRVAEVRDTPVLTVLDAARAPDRRSFPRWWILAAVGSVLGLVMGLVIAYAPELRLSSERRAEPEVQRVLTAWRGLLAAAPWRRRNAT